MQCVRTLGVTCRLYGDRPITSSNPNGSYFWKSYFSQVEGWMLRAPVKFHLWFLQGIADSDGYINLRNKQVEIVSSPNTRFFHSLLMSLGTRSLVRVSLGYGYVTVTAPAAQKMQIVNPELFTYRKKLLEKLVLVKTFQRHWRAWLEEVVNGLIAEGIPAP